MQKIKLAVIGTGRIGKLHVENIQHFVPSLEVIAVADVMIEHSREWAEEHEIPHIFQDYHDALALDEVDAVVIATPTPTHAEIAVAAAEAGKDIFCEKPIDLNVEATMKVVEAVKRNGVKCQIGFNRRFDHNFRRIHEGVEEGLIGTPQIIRVTSRDPEPPSPEYVATSGGLFRDMMIHDFDMVRYLSGDEVKKVTAHGAVLIDPAIGEAGDIDTAVVTLEMESGAIAVIDNSRQAAYGYDQRAEVFGSKGKLMANNDKLTNVDLYTKESVQNDRIYHFFLDRYTGAFVDQFKAFAAALQGEGEIPVSAVDGLRALELALAAGESLKTGQTVELKRHEID